MYGKGGGFFTTDPTIAAWDGQDANRVSTYGAETLPVTPEGHFCAMSAEGRISYITVGKLDNATGAYRGDLTVWENSED